MLLITKTPISPITPTKVSMTVQVESVSLTVRLKYSLNIQKPVSLTWESIKLPDPMANTINSGLVPVPEAKGSTIPAAVSPATVADPTLTRMAVAISQAKTKGDMLEPLRLSAI